MNQENKKNNSTGRKKLKKRAQWVPDKNREPDHMGINGRLFSRLKIPKEFLSAFRANGKFVQRDSGFLADEF